jgi:hypothetical protein
LVIVGGGFRIDHHVGILIRAVELLPRAAAKKIQRRIVGDTKQPALGGDDRSRFCECLKRFQERFLNHILSVDDRAGHTRAVAMQLRPQSAKQLLECVAACTSIDDEAAHRSPSIR